MLALSDPFGVFDADATTKSSLGEVIDSCVLVNEELEECLLLVLVVKVVR